MIEDLRIELRAGRTKSDELKDAFGTRSRSWSWMREGVGELVPVT